MNFVVNLFDSGIFAQMPTGHFVRMIIANFLVPALVFFSFWISKKFIGKRLSDPHTKGLFGYSLTFVPALIIAPIASFIFCVILNAIFGVTSVTQSDFIPDGYLMFSMIIAFAIVATYTILLPDHANHRLIELEDKQSIEIYRKYLRASLITLIFCSATAVLEHFVTRTPSDIFFAVFCATLALGYVFFELTLTRKNISEMLQLSDEKYFCSATQLVTFINEKFISISVAAAALIFVDNIFFEPRSHFLFFEILSDVIAVVLSLLLLQIVTSNVLKRMQISLEKYKTKIDLNEKQMNTLDIYNTSVLSTYSLLGYWIVSECIKLVVKNPLCNRLFGTGCVLLVTAIIFKMYAALKQAFLLKSKRLSSKHHAKSLTFIPIISAAFYIVVVLISVSIILANWGADVSLILAAFSFTGAAVVLAVKDTVQSLIHGILLLMEENLFVGEYVKIGSFSGVIERLSMRVMYLRNEDGSLQVIPYNKVETIVNMSKDYTYHSDKLRVAEGQSVEKVVELLKETITEMREDEKYAKIITSDVQVHGIVPIDLTGLQIYWNVKTVPDNPNIKYEIYRRLIEKFEKNGIKVPVAENFSLPIAAK